MGGLELFIIGKNFLKDTRVVFQARRSSSPHRDGYEILWEETCLPDKEFLQQVSTVTNNLQKMFQTINSNLFVRPTSYVRYRHTQIQK